MLFTLRYESPYNCNCMFRLVLHLTFFLVVINNYYESLHHCFKRGKYSVSALLW